MAYFKFELIPAVLSSAIALLLIAVIYHNGEIKLIKEKLDELTSKKKKGVIDIVTAIIIVVIILLIIYILLQSRVGGYG